MTHLEAILEQVDRMVDEPFVTAKFGDNWREHAKSEYNANSGLYDLDNIIDIAWRQGRRAILLEKALKDILEANEI